MYSAGGIATSKNPIAFFILAGVFQKENPLLIFDQKPCRF
jgi:hypothetical protein